MPYPKTDPWYILRIHQYAADGLRAPTIKKKLDADAAAETPKRTDAPSLRTVAREVEKYDILPPAVQAEQQPFHWPEAMESGALPWEASAVALELLAYYDEDAPPDAPTRPFIGQCRWAYYVRLAAPTMPIYQVAGMATMFWGDAYRRAANIAPLRTALGNVWWLAYRVWESDERLAAYLKAGERHGYDELRSTAVRQPPAQPEKESVE